MKIYLTVRPPSMKRIHIRTTINYNHFNTNTYISMVEYNFIRNKQTKYSREGE